MVTDLFLANAGYYKLCTRHEHHETAVIFNYNSLYRTSVDFKKGSVTLDPQWLQYLVVLIMYVHQLLKSFT